MDTDECRSWRIAEEKERSNKDTKRKLKNVKWTTVSIKVPVCPKCKTAMKHELDTEMRELWKWYCPKCRFTI